MPTLRPMLAADVDQATDMILSHDWGVRREFLAFATSQPACTPMVAAANGTIVGTGVGTANETVGWIGTIFLAPAWRGQGLGRAITQAIIDRLEAMGARTLVLVATADGRRLYETMGFEVQTRYRIFEAPGLAGPGASAESRSVRGFRAEDLEAILAIDRDGTGEDRGHVIRRLATPETARVALGIDGTIEGFVIRAPWGGGATVARSVEASLDIVAARRVSAGPDGRVRVGLLQENASGMAQLEAIGFAPSWSAPRMIRGEPLTWHPESIWGQFNHAIG
ncbi:MAG: GNAT family N-acetyltransferase [Candidatus Limnocylindrales bacterium]